MQYKHLPAVILALLLFATTARAQQGIAINATGNAPDASAILDVQSTAKGMLVPRMSALQRMGITTPAMGLLVYDIDSTAFYFYTGTAWAKIAGGNGAGDNLGNHTATQNLNMNGKVISADGSGYGLAMGSNGSVVDSGVSGAGADLSVTGAGTRMVWYPKAAAFRAGAVDGNQWDSNNIGPYSVAMGQNNKVIAANGSAFGWANTVTATGAFAAGWNNTASGQFSTAFGQQNNVSGYASGTIGLANNVSGGTSFVAGYNASVTGSTSIAMGRYVTAGGDYSLALGYNAIAAHTGSIVMGDAGNLVLATDGPNQFKARYQGGYSFYADGTQTNGLLISPTTGVAKYFNNVASSYDARSLVDKNYVDSNIIAGGHDNLGNHTATQNIQLNNNWLSNDGDNEGIRIDNNGIVSVNTATPVAQSKLTVAGSTSITGFDGNFGLGGNRALIDYSGGYMRLGTVNGGGAATNGIGFLANGTEKMRLLATGSLGVNNNNPGATLDVSGNASIGSGNSVTGGNALAVGSGNTITGSSSFAAGGSNTVSGNGSYAVGGNNIVTNINSMAIGLSDTSGGYASFVANRENNASGNHAAAFGYHNQATSFDEFVIGMYSTPYTPASTTGYNGNDRLFNIGNGTNVGATADAFTVLKNGKTGIGNNVPAEKLDVTGNIRSTDTVKTAKFRMSNGANNGYVLTGDAAGNAKWTSPNSLGVTETDPQVSSGATYKVPRWNGTTLVDGSMYDSSGRVGINTSTPGTTLDVAGNASIGGPNVVAGPSLAAGYRDTATGYASFAANRDNNASGNHSSAFGSHSQAPSYVEFVIGQFATPYTPASTTGFNSADRLFNVGNGNSTVPADAFTILKNGKVGVGRSTPAANLDVAGTFVSGTANAATGAQAAVIGGNTNKAAGTNAVAGGSLSYASGSNSVAIGSNDTATGQSSVTFGDYSKATGSESAAIGSNSLAGGPQSFAVGSHATAGGWGSSAIGLFNTASGVAATALGSSNSAVGDYSFSVGRENNATGGYSVAIGRRANTNSKGGSFVFGDSTANYTFSDTTNQMKMRFQGGYKLYADAAQSRGIQVVPATGVAKYFSNVASSYDAQSLVDKNYVDSNVNARITGIAETDPQVSSSTTNVVPKWNGTTLVDGQLYDDGTNIGIGTTAPNALLHVQAGQGKIKVQSSNDVPTYMALTTQYRNWIIGNNRPWDNNSATDGFYVYDSSAAATRFYIDPSGNAGIGTTTPGTKLEVTGIMRVTGTTAANLELNSPSTPTIYPNGPATPANQNMEMRSAGSGTLALNFSNPGSIQMAAGGGGVLIGTGSTVAAKLDVNGSFKLGASGTPLSNIIKVSGATGPYTIPAGTYATFTYTANGATLGATAFASPGAAMTDGLIISYTYVNAANQVTVRIANPTGGSLVMNSPALYITVIN